MSVPTNWPIWMDQVKAKSATYGGETLAQHTWDVLAKLAELHQLRPQLAQQMQFPRLWHCLFWACLLHDFGKAAQGFQARLAGGPPWNQRHEVLSLVFLDWIADGLNNEEQDWVLAAIASHHRDADYIEKVYADVSPDPLEPLLAEVKADTIAHLWRWVYECSEAWRDALGFTAIEVAPITIPSRDAAIMQVQIEGIQRVRRWLYRYTDWVSQLRDAPTSKRVLGILFRGLTTSADHMASAHLEHMPAPINEPWAVFAERLLAALRSTTPGAQLYQHQVASATAATGSAILVAPTGSAKTESALFWALGDGSLPVSRLFYALPYQASMNAMFDRLRDTQRGFGDAAVGIQHGRALQAMYARLINSERWSATAVSTARWAQNINTLNARPVKVFSPYQMLKTLFQLRGFEAMLTDYVGAAFIFDEIHAYEPSRLALMLTLIRYLREHYGARFFVMSATFPRLIQDRLQHALGDHTIIRADQSIFDAFARHLLQMLNGELFDGLDRIAHDLYAGKQVLVCVNTVRRAQEVRARLSELGIADDQLVLIHSRFTIQDRTRLEDDIRQRSSLDAVVRTPFILIATQVVEVSLNIDLDTIYTDPAPLEALLQRFGRVNRARKKGICPVYVFREPRDGQGVYGRSKNPQEQGYIVRVTLAELECHNNTTIDEAAINSWLDRIYDDQLVKRLWVDEYTRVVRSAEYLVDSLTPFESSDQKEEDFERLFDGIDVLPACFEQTYLNQIADHCYLEASQYFVSISKQRYARFAREGKIRAMQDPEGYLKGKRWLVDLPYDAQNGLQFDAPINDRDWS